MRELARRAEHGSVAVEVAVLAPALVVLLLLVVAGGRVSQTDGDVERAAGSATRAASLQLDTQAAVQAARDAATANLAATRVTCNEIKVEVDLSNFRAGGSVATTVSCTAPMTELSLLGIPGHRTFTARSVAVVDRYRGGGA